jgi:RimJ/RimL family protein N-acetyltransferase
VPRRIAPPPNLGDDTVTLEPLARALAGDMGWLLEPDPDTAAFTYIPTEPDAAFLDHWLDGYEEGWETGERAGFAICADGRNLGFAAFVRLDLDAAQGELGYVLAPDGRGRGLASRAVALLTAWGFDELALERIELRIDPRNVASERVAERAGYTQEGILRSVAFKEGRRTNVGIWSRLRAD